jgi:hypothetical protein
MQKSRSLPKLPDNPSADGETKSNIGLPELTDAYIEVVGMYEDLAKQHDALVDSVTKNVLNKQ